MCGWSHSADRDDMIRFMRAGWPQCCGYVPIFRIVHDNPALAEPAD